MSKACWRGSEWLAEVPPARTRKAAAAAPGTTRASIARAAGILAFALIIIPVAIAALQVLGIEAISGPAIAMLNQILAAIPRILAAGLWIGIAFIAAKFLKSIIEAILPPTGFDDAVLSTGIVPAGASPSRIVGNIAMVAIILIAAIEAAKQLGGGTIAVFLAQVTELGGKVIFGTLIIVAGIFLARIISGFVGSGTGEGGYGQDVVRYSIIALFTAIGLTFMGLADQIVMMAFGLVLGSAAVAAALAFGLGGRDAAARALDKMSNGGLPKPRPAEHRAGAAGARRRARGPLAAAGVRTRFDAFVAIDWSGAKGRRHKGIAIAEARGDAAPRLVRPGHVWSRDEVADWLVKRAAQGADPVRLRLQLRAADHRAAANICRANRACPTTAREFWAYVDAPLRRRGPRRRELPRAAPPPPFLFRHRRWREGRLHALPPMRRAVECAGRAQDRHRPMTRSARRRSPRRAFRACACSTRSTARSRSGRWTRCPRTAARWSKSTPASTSAARG